MLSNSWHSHHYRMALKKKKEYGGLLHVLQLMCSLVLQNFDSEKEEGKRLSMSMCFVGINDTLSLHRYLNIIESQGYRIPKETKRKFQKGN
mmetsp:Transcript_14846/g.23547  ORF Transcript_14846/g.23547 Transcript_14846/m.23547 type:complete len:91 (-) Transcript_14846:861-1133(-)